METEQVTLFKYLDITFSHIFLYSKGGQYISAAIKAFNAKVLPQILYGINSWINGDSDSVYYPLLLYL